MLGSNSSNVNPGDFVIQKSLVGNPTNYIDSTSFVYLMAQGPEVFDNMSSSDIYTDFVRIVVTGKGASFPINPTLNIGDDDDIEWVFSGIFDMNLVIDDNDNFKSELQSFIDLAEPGCKYVDIPLNFTSATGGKIKISNISITYEFPEINLPPELAKDIPNGTYGFYEDSNGGDNLIDLNDYYWDDRDNGTLTFVILKNNEDVSAELDFSGHHLDFYSKQDCFGTFEFQVRAIDKGFDGMIGFDLDLHTDSNIFTIEVWPTNDAPVLDSIGGVAISDDMTELKFKGVAGAREDVWFNKTIVAHDIDGDVLGFECNLSLIEPAIIEIIHDYINKTASEFTLLATNNYVGTLKMNIMVTDNNESDETGDFPNQPLTDSIDLSVEVQNSNDRPELTPIGDFIGSEDQWLNFTLHGTDDDLIYGDMLRFFTNITSAIDGLDEGYNYFFNEKTGDVSILPDNSMVGTHLVEFEISDFDGETDSETLKITITNVNDLPFPIITSPKRVLKVNTTTKVYFDGANSTDDDLIHGDTLSFLWSSNISGVLSTSSKFSTNFSDVGRHMITLSVTDSSGEEVQEFIDIQISAVANKPDDNNGNKDDDGSDNLDKKGDNEINEFMMGAIILVIIVVISLILVFMWQRKKSRKSEADVDPATGTPGPGSVPSTGQASPIQQSSIQQPPIQQIPVQPLPLTPPPMVFPGQPMVQTQPVMQLPPQQYYQPYVQPQPIQPPITIQPVQPVQTLSLPPSAVPVAQQTAPPPAQNQEAKQESKEQMQEQS
jgi:hypothetical protein